MSSWSSVVALSGFQYDGVEEAVIAVPRLPHRAFRSFWASGTGWGEFSYAPGTRGGTFFTLRVLAGNLRCRSVMITAVGERLQVRLGENVHDFIANTNGQSTTFTMKETIMIAEGQELLIEARG
jgi:non-lysosomal glucosylceramidase